MLEADATPPVLERQGARAIIRLNRPKHLNRLQADDLNVLMSLFAEVEAGGPIGALDRLQILVLLFVGHRFLPVAAWPR